MDGLIQIVADSFIRHGLESPAVGDPRFVWGRAPSPVQAEPNSAGVGGQSTTGYALAQTTRPAEPSALPEHNYGKSNESDPAP